MKRTAVYSFKRSGDVSEEDIVRARLYLEEVLQATLHDPTLELTVVVINEVSTDPSN